MHSWKAGFISCKASIIEIILSVKKHGKPPLKMSNLWEKKNNSRHSLCCQRRGKVCDRSSLCPYAQVSHPWLGELKPPAGLHAYPSSYFSVIFISTTSLDLTLLLFLEGYCTTNRHYRSFFFHLPNTHCRIKKPRSFP